MKDKLQIHVIHGGQTDVKTRLGRVERDHHRGGAQEEGLGVKTRLGRVESLDHVDVWGWGYEAVKTRLGRVESGCY